jgi:putative PIN family toxin of toxin-antitoxin system
VISVTADSNIYISALEFGGVPLQFLNAARAGGFQLAISDALLKEIVLVLGGKFSWEQENLGDLRLELESFTQRVQPAQTLQVIKADPDDDRVLECAVAAGSQFIVTGDRHLLELGTFGQIQIIKVADFLKLLQIPVT